MTTTSKMSEKSAAKTLRHTYSIISKPEPEPISKSIPINSIPERLSEFVDDMCNVYQCHRDFIMNAIFCAVAATVGNKIKVNDGKYINSLQLWFINIAKSGENKTKPVRLILDPLFEIQHEMVEQYKKEMMKYKASQKKESIPVPLRRQLIVSDVTEEARMKILSENPHGVLCYYPEARGFFDDLIRYSGNDGSSKMMRIFDGDTLIVNRKSENELLEIRDPFMCFIGDIQNDIVAKVFDNEVFCSNGFNQRFIFTKIDTGCYRHYTTSTLNKSNLELWCSVIRRLYEFKNVDDGYITLSAGAKNTYEEFYNMLQDMKNISQVNYEISIFSKAQIQVLRIAGILQMINYAMNENDPEAPLQIDMTTMKKAISIMEFYISQHSQLATTFTNAQGDSTNSLTLQQLIRAIGQRINIENQAEFARCLGISPSTVSRALNSK